MPIKDVSDRSLAELSRLDGRVAVVTGAALGIGRAISRRLVESGATVVAADINEGALAETVAAIAKETGGTIEGAFVDVRDSPTIDALVDGAVSRHGKIDIMVCNAGIYPNQTIDAIDDEAWGRVFEINVRGASVGARAAARHMIARGAGGVIVTLGSVNGYRAFGPGLTHYTASKHAIHGLTKALAVELGPHDIRVVSVAPTMVETEGVAVLRDVMGESEFGPAMQAMAEKHPAGRVAAPDDIARVAVWLTTDAAVMVNGTAVDVDGGYLSA
ncbi:MAG: SDR family oxidoreductase [Actinobacteria bacterium]|nr:SDR family oxidoreductase [Actinomycetota bacterium]